MARLATAHAGPNRRAGQRGASGGVIQLPRAGDALCPRALPPRRPCDHGSRVESETLGHPLMPLLLAANAASILGHCDHRAAGDHRRSAWCRAVVPAARDQRTTMRHTGSWGGGSGKSKTSSTDTRRAWPASRAAGGHGAGQIRSRREAHRRPLGRGACRGLGPEPRLLRRCPAEHLLAGRGLRQDRDRARRAPVANRPLAGEVHSSSSSSTEQVTAGLGALGQRPLQLRTGLRQR